MEPRTEAALLGALDRLVQRIEATLPELAEPLKMFVAGGLAAHYYTGSRYTEDVDASFSKRLLFPEHLETAWVDAAGQPRLLYLDRQYNDSFALMHEDYDLAAVPCDELNRPGRKVEIYFLSPVDLAVSKIARFADVDRDDIAALARAGLVAEPDLRRRAEEALGGYVGDLGRVRSNIDLACRIVRSGEANAV